MRKLNLCILLGISVFSLKGQINLVPNGNFEKVARCPNDSFAAAFRFLERWKVVLRNPALHHSCTNEHAGMGVELFDTKCYVMPKSGNAFAGLTSYLTIPRTTTFIGVDLNSTLKPGKKYYIHFFVLPLIKCFRVKGPRCYSDALGLAFSDSAYQQEVIVGAEQIPPFPPAIHNPSGNLIKDTLNRTEIAGCYTAKGTERFAIIGNFRTSAASRSEGCIGATGTYHFIDDVGVYEYDPLPDTILLCAGAPQ